MGTLQEALLAAARLAEVQGNPHLAQRQPPATLMSSCVPYTFCGAGVWSAQGLRNSPNHKPVLPAVFPHFTQDAGHATVVVRTA